MLIAILIIGSTFIPSVLGSGDIASRTLDNPTALLNLAVPTKPTKQIMRSSRNKAGLIVGCTIAGIFFIVVLSVIIVAHMRQLKRRAITEQGGEGDQIAAAKSEPESVAPEQRRTEGDGHFGSTLAV